MRIQYDMTREQIEEMVDSEGWEILSEQNIEENGEDAYLMLKELKK